MTTATSSSLVSHIMEKMIVFQWALTGQADLKLLDSSDQEWLRDDWHNLAQLPSGEEYAFQYSLIHNLVHTYMWQCKFFYALV